MSKHRHPDRTGKLNWFEKQYYVMATAIRRPPEKVIAVAEAPKTPLLRPWHWWIGGATGFGVLSGMVRSVEQLMAVGVGLLTAAGLVVAYKLAAKEPKSGRVTSEK